MPRLRYPAAATALLLSSAALLTSTSGAQDAEFQCDPGYFQVDGDQLTMFDPITEDDSDLGGPASSDYDAIGYNWADGLLYGVQGSDLIRIDPDGTVTALTNIPSIAGSTAGDFGADGLLHVSAAGANWQTIDVTTYAVNALPAISVANDVLDFVSIGSNFYGVDRGGDLWVYDPVGGTVTSGGAVADLQGSGHFVAAYTDSGDNFYVRRRTGHFFQITGYSTGSPVANAILTAPVINSGDGASCAEAPAPEGVPDVDGPVSELDPSYDIGDAGLGEGASCSNDTVDVDRAARDAVAPVSVTEPTVLYQNAYESASADYKVLDGSWQIADGTLTQLNTCGYDYTALLLTSPVEHFTLSATLTAEVNNGGFVIHQSSDLTRSGATLIDFSQDGAVLRWGSYDAVGYYQLGGTTPVTIGTSVDLSLTVHGTAVDVYVDGVLATSVTADNSSGYVGLVTSVASVSFDDVTLTAIPAS